jgi:hypothetical protein
VLNVFGFLKTLVKKKSKTTLLATNSLISNWRYFTFRETYRLIRVGVGPKVKEAVIYL